MSRKQFNVGKRLLAMLLTFILLVQGVALNVVTVKANGESENNSAQNSGTLKVTNLSWKEGSNATAKWDAFEGANYYEIKVFVSYNGELIGSTTTGTTETEVDLQQEINYVVCNKQIDTWVYVKFSVSAFFQEGNQKVLLTDDVSESLEKIYKLYEIQELPDIHMKYDSETCTFSWDIMEELEDNRFTFWIDLEGDLQWYGPSEDEFYVENNRRCLCIKEWFDNLYIPNKITISPSVSVTVKGEYATIYNENTYIYLEPFEYEPTDKQKLKKQINPNMAFDISTCTFSWDIMEELDDWRFTFWIDLEGDLQWYGPSEDEFYIENNRRCICIKDWFDDLYIPNKMTITPMVSVTVKGEYSTIYEESTDIQLESFEYEPTEKQSQKKVLNPNLVYDEVNCVLSWDDMDELSVTDLFFGYDSGVLQYSIGTDEIISKDGRKSLNIWEWFNKLYFPNEVSITPIVRVTPKYEYSNIYRDAEIELPTFKYRSTRKKVEKINISPNTPIICLGNSYYLGKSIEPADAYYETIVWSSGNESIVTIDEKGLITAHIVGDTSITAEIEGVSCTVPVKVYEIETNLDREEDKQIVTDEAGKVLDDIISNDEPDLSKTDIQEENVEQIKEEVQEAIITGNEISTDLIEEEKSETEIEDAWKDITEAYENENVEFAGAYDVEIEMYYTDDEGEDHHIGNIVELDSEVEFTLPLPEEVINADEEDEYALVRVHDGTVEEIDATHNDDGTFTTQSDKYSAFVWVKKVTSVHTHGGNNATYHKAVAATCTTAGNSAYYECNCGTYFSDKACTKEIKKDSWIIAKKGHSYGDATYTWASDYKTVTGTKVCKRDSSHTDTEKVTTTYKVIKDATETATGIGRYTATFTKEGFTTQVKDVTIDKLEHTHGGSNATYHKAVAATCEKAGNSAYYSCSCGKYFTDKACTKEISKNSWVIAKLGHNYGKATYIWSADNKSVTGTRVCQNDASHVDTETVTTTYKIVTEATETADGLGRYTATFTKSGFKTQTKDVTITKLSHKHGGNNITYHKAVAATCEKAGNSAYYSCSCGKYFSDKACTKEIDKDSWVINATGHNYGKASYKWSSDYKTVTGTRVCKNDTSHTDTEKVTTTYEIIKKPTETSTGTGRYTAVFTKEGFTTQTKDVEIDKLEPEVPPSKGDVTKKFTDVLENEWYVPAIQFVYDRAIMNGVSGTSFGTKGTLTREQFITVLYNLEGSPETTFKKYFDDVTDETSWYAKSVTWAAENGITSGVGGNKFGVGVEITREQLATLLYNYAQKKDEYKLSIDENAVANFSDANKIDSWASDGMKWAITNGVMGGKAGKDGQKFLDPLGKATRAECAQMIKNLKENAVK